MPSRVMRVPSCRVLNGSSVWIWARKVSIGSETLLECTLNTQRPRQYSLFWKLILSTPIMLLCSPITLVSGIELTSEWQDSAAVDPENSQLAPGWGTPPQFSFSVACATLLLCSCHRSRGLHHWTGLQLRASMSCVINFTMCPTMNGVGTESVQ